MGDNPKSLQAPRLCGSTTAIRPNNRRTTWTTRMPLNAMRREQLELRCPRWTVPLCTPMRIWGCAGIGRTHEGSTGEPRASGLRCLVAMSAIHSDLSQTPVPIRCGIRSRARWSRLVCIRVRGSGARTDWWSEFGLLAGPLRRLLPGDMCRTSSPRSVVEAARCSVRPRDHPTCAPRSARVCWVYLRSRS